MTMEFFGGGSSIMPGDSGGYHDEFQEEAGAASRSTGPAPLIPPYGTWNADYQTASTQLPPLQNFTFSASDPTSQDFLSPSLRQELFGAPSPEPPPFLIPGSSARDLGISLIPTGAGPSIFSFDAPRDVPCSNGLPSLAQCQDRHSALRSPTIPLEAPPQQLPMPSASTSTWPDEFCDDYISPYQSATFADTSPNTRGAYYGFDDGDPSWPALQPYNQYQRDDESFPELAFTNDEPIAQLLQSPRLAEVSGDYEIVDLTKTEPGLETADNMPTSSSVSGRTASGRKRRASSSVAESSNKRRRTPASSPSSSHPKAPAGRRRPSRCVEERKVSFGDDDDEDDVQIIDLSNTDKVPEELLKPAVDTSVKLSGYECIICMDRCSDITVTHCGHLFCGNCLHQSINMNPDKKICPICRQKLDLRPSHGRQPSRIAKTYFHLELKLMPKNRQGKLPATR